MQELLDLLFWAGTIAGGLLIVLLLLSIFGGLDIGGDVDVDAAGGADASLGLLKTLFTFLSVGAFTARAIFLSTAVSWPLATLFSLIAGVLAVLLLTGLFRWLLRNQESGNWYLWQTEGKLGRVYVPVPADGEGRITVLIDNVNREIAARSDDGQAIATHEEVLILEAKEDYVVVRPIKVADAAGG